MSQVSGAINNPNLKPEKITNYELGFEQALNQSSAIKISAYYKETRDLIQLVQYVGADPNPNYYSYDNIDFKTTKGFSLAYDLRRTKNIRLSANYTLQYAEGTGISATTMQQLIKEGFSSLKVLSPIADDRRHEFKLNLDFRYQGGAKYNGPTWTRKVKDENGEERSKTVNLLENFGVNINAVAQSGRPYTKALSSLQSTIVGSYRGARLPWGFYIDAVVDKMWTINIKNGEKERPTFLRAAVAVTNVLDIRNILGVYPVTGNPDDNGYLTDPETQSLINAYMNPDSYRDLYAIMLMSGWNYSSPRMIRLELTYQF
jgi:outer membrane receptor protein involved in Fe transport